MDRASLMGLPFGSSDGGAGNRYVAVARRSAWTAYGFIAANIMLPSADNFKAMEAGRYSGYPCRPGHRGDA